MLQDVHADNEDSPEESVDDGSDAVASPKADISPIGPHIRYNIVRYTRLFNAYYHDTSSPTDSLTVSPRDVSSLHDSEVLNTLWAADEKERFFTALARCGKGNLPEVARRVRTKSLAEVTAYLGLLDVETAERKKTSRKRRVFDLSKVPAAVEVGEHWLEFEERAAKWLGYKSDRAASEELPDGDLVLNVDRANELAGWYQNMLAPSNTPAKLSSPIIKDMDDLIISLTRRLLRTVSCLVSTRHRNMPSTSPMVTVPDVHTAVDLLALPRYFSQHFTTLPRRMHQMGVKLAGIKGTYYKDFGMDGGHKIVTPEIMESILTTGPPSRRSRVDTRVKWPVAWDISKGFNWDSELVQEEASNLEAEAQTENGEMEVPEILEGLELLSRSPSPARRRKVDREMEENTLLEAEAAYLDALDEQWAEIEQRHLTDFIKHGEASARRSQRHAIKTFLPSDETKKREARWRKVKKCFIARYGYDWVSYPEEIAGDEGKGWEHPPENWELVQKHNPSNKRKASGGSFLPRKKPNLGDESESQSEGIEYSDLDSECEDTRFNT